VPGPAGYFAAFSEVFSGLTLGCCHHRRHRDRQLAGHLPRPGAVAAALTWVLVALTAAQAVL
jgi:putative drug exporter of the RND superfamily